MFLASRTRAHETQMPKQVKTLGLVSTKVRGKQQSDPRGQGIVALTFLARGTILKDKSLPYFCTKQEAPTQVRFCGDKYISVPKRGYWPLQHTQGKSLTYFINQANQPPHYKKPNLVLKHVACGELHKNKRHCRTCSLQMLVVNDIAKNNELVWAYKQN